MKNKKIVLLLCSLLIAMSSFFYNTAFAVNLDSADYLDEYKRIPATYQDYRTTGYHNLHARVVKADVNSSEGTPTSYIYLFSEIGKSADNGYPLIHESDVEAWVGYYGRSNNSSYTSYVKEKLNSKKIIVRVGRADQVFYNLASVAEIAGGRIGSFYQEKVGNKYKVGFKNHTRYTDNHPNKVEISAPAKAKVGESVRIKYETSDGSHYILRHQTWYSQIMKGGQTVKTLINWEPQKTARNQAKTLTNVFTEPGTYTITFSVDDNSYHSNSRTGTTNYSDSITIVIVDDDSTIPNPNPDPDPEEPDRETTDDPSGEHKQPGSTPGQASGNAFWELRRTDEARASDVYAESSFSKTGTHYETRNERQSMRLGSHPQIQRLGKITSTVNAGSVKNQNMQYEYSYDFTNYYYDRYECVDSDEKGCYEWSFVERTPVWNKGETYRLNGTLKMDHRQHDLIKKGSIEEVLQEKLLVGRSDTWTNNNRSSNAYYENFYKQSNHFKSNVTLKTQGSMIVKPDTLAYEVILPSEIHKQGNFKPFKRGYINGWYYPADVDPSLQEELANDTGYDLGDYSLFLQQSSMRDSGMLGNKRSFKLDFVSDHMLSTANTGFMISYPYAKKMNRHLIYGEQKPTEQQVFDTVEFKMKKEFEEQTGQVYLDEIMYVKDGISLDEWEKYQRYWIPVTPKSPLQPHTTYVNNILLENAGLNDVTWQYGQQFLFEHWLFGSGHDEAWLIEQPEPRIPVDLKDTNRILIKNEDFIPIMELYFGRTKERMHEFRRADQDWVEKMANFVPGWYK